MKVSASSRSFVGVNGGIYTEGCVMDLDSFLSKNVKSSTQQRSFVHFTDRSNLVSLKKHGLLSARELRRRGIAARFGGNQWSIDRDLATGMDAYVHLCFTAG